MWFALLAIFLSADFILLAQISAASSFVPLLHCSRRSSREDGVRKELHGLLVVEQLPAGSVWLWKQGRMRIVLLAFADSQFRPVCAHLRIMAEWTNGTVCVATQVPCRPSVHRHTLGSGHKSDARYPCVDPW